MREQLPEYTYPKNEKTFTEVMISFVRGILETVFPFFRIKPFSILYFHLRNGDIYPQ